MGRKKGSYTHGVHIKGYVKIRDFIITKLEEIFHTQKPVESILLSTDKQISELLKEEYL